MSEHIDAKPGELPIDPELLLNCLQENATEEQLKELEQKIELSEESRHEVLHLSKLYHAARSFNRMESRNSMAAYHQVMQRIRQKESKQRGIPYLYIAASLIGAVLLSSLLHLFSPEKFYKVSDIVVQTNPGVRTKVSLPDGSQVELNSGSKITYASDFNTTNRQVTLIGEGMFRVKRGNRIPFVVNSESKRGSVRVKGTTFNVQSFEKAHLFTTTLLEGSVDVSVVHRDGSVETRILRPHEKLGFFMDVDSVALTGVDGKDEIAWTKGRLVFRKEPMGNVLKRLAYYYNVEFDVRNPSIYRNEFTGTFDNKQLPQILEYLKISSHINYHIQHPRTDDSQGLKRTRITLRQ